MMSKTFHKSLMAMSASALVLAGGAAVLTATSVATAVAQEEEETQNQSLSQNVAKDVQEAYRLATEEENFPAAIQVLNRLEQQRGGSMTPYEKATLYELRGSFKFQLAQSDVDGAIRDFESAIATGALGAERERQLRFNIAQLYFQEERYADALRLLNDYVRFQQNAGLPVNANTWYLIAAANVALDDFRSARQPMERALAAKKAEGKPEKSYYQLMNYIYSEVGASSERGDLLVEMINYWPEEENYWAQLSGSYSAAGRDADAAAVLELAYRAGIITEASKVIALVQYYTILDNPYRGAQLLEKEMAAGNIERNLENLQLLAQCYNLAREQEKALVPLRQAAEMAPSGELYYRLGQIYFADEQWEQSIASLTSALNRGGLDSNDTGDAWLLIGNAHYNIDSEDPGRREQAKAAWRRAQNYSRSRSAAGGWLEYLRQVELTETRMDEVERLQREEAFKNETRRCKTNLEIFDRLGTAGGFSEEDAAKCRRILGAKWNGKAIVLEDGTTVQSVNDV